MECIYIYIYMYEVGILMYYDIEELKLLPSMMRGGDASACSQKDTQDMATIIIDGRK